VTHRFLRLDRPSLSATAADIYLFANLVRPPRHFSMPGHRNPPLMIPMSVQDETKPRWVPGCWPGAREAYIRGDLQRASNEASSPEDKRISLILNAIWN
jgi:hypothetical protein